MEIITTEFRASRAVDRLKDVRARLLPCRPPIWAPDGHLQTILGHYLPSPTLQEKGEVLNVTLECEEERIVTTYLKGRTRTVVYLFHGLGGFSHAGYMQRTAQLARRMGHHVFLNNHRGCGEGAGLATEPYHSGRSEDLSAVIAFGRRMLPGHKHIAVGFSLSANALLLLAAGIRANIQPDAAIAVNGPINLEHCSVRLDHGLNLVYSYRFVRELRHSLMVREKTGRMKRSYDLPWNTTLRDLDEIYTAPAGGFDSRLHYYRTCSSDQYLSRVTIPTVLLTAADDPIVQVSDYESARLSDRVVMHVEEHGGHMGYLSREKTPLGNHRWLDYALREYLTALS